MSKIELTDSTFDVVMKMSEGNPGAADAIMQMLKGGEEIDPQGLMGGFGNILMLDTWEIYGTEIYILWNDKCQWDLRKLCVLLRGCQLGLFPVKTLKNMASDQMRKVEISDEEYQKLDDAVCEALPEFQKPKEEVLKQSG